MIKYNKQLCVRCLEPATVNCPIKYACFEVLGKGMVYFRYMFDFFPQNNRIMVMLGCVAIFHYISDGISQFSKLFPRHNQRVFNSLSNVQNTNSRKIVDASEQIGRKLNINQFCYELRYNE